MKDVYLPYYFAIRVTPGKAERLCFPLVPLQPVHNAILDEPLAS